MKYTNYIINGKTVNINSIISNKKYIRHFTVVVAIPVAFTGICVLSGLLPFAVMIDGARYVKLKYYNISRKQKYVENIKRIYKIKY